MKASGIGWCDGRRLGAPSIVAGESLHEYPNAAADGRRRIGFWDFKLTRAAAAAELGR
jgi:hypothetical protein